MVAIHFEKGTKILKKYVTPPARERSEREMESVEAAHPTNCASEASAR
jgi:hypothetical protein